jgi:NAD(P)-dependent dehydrogenase (short-subunit alcohol dehydrogenase family)
MRSGRSIILPESFWVLLPLAQTYYRECHAAEVFVSSSTVLQAVARWNGKNGYIRKKGKAMPGNAWNLKGKSVLITGAARGIGAATARLLAGHQTRLSLIDIEGAALQQLARDLGETMLYQQADITQSDSMEEAVAATVQRFGRIDVAVVNAGIVTVGSVERGDPDAFERVVDVNLLGSWKTVRAVLPHIIKAQGYLLFVSSLSGTIQGPLHAAYNSSKAGLQAFANTLRLEVQGLGVDVGVAHNIYTATQTGRAAVEHPLIRGLPGLPKMKPQPVEKTAAMLVRGIERRSRTIIVPAARLALLAPEIFQLAVERMARRHRWAAAIQKLEQVGEERVVE